MLLSRKPEDLMKVTLAVHDTWLFCSSSVKAYVTVKKFAYVMLALVNVIKQAQVIREEGFGTVKNNINHSCML